MVTPTPTTVQVKIQLRIDTAATWASVNPILLAGEMGLESDTNKVKVGNGSTAWNSLGYFPFVVSGGTVTGNLEIGSTGTLTFEGSTANDFETTLGVVDPTADRTINLPNVSGTIITTGDTGTVTSAMIADGAIVDADISGTAEISVSKLANGTANQVLVTDGTDVSWSDDLTLAGNLTVNGTTTTVNTETLLVEDKNIELGVVDTPTDLTADGGGITLKGTTDKTINWIDATDAWTLSEHVNIASGKEYRIDGTKVLDATSLGSAVVSSSLTSVGTLTGLTTSGDVTLNAQSDLRFADSDSSNWVAFQAPATVASNVTWTLPSADGTTGQVLSTDGAGALSWATASGGASVTTSDTAPSSPSDGDLWYDSVGGRTYVYYDDGDTSQWVDASPQGGGAASLWTQGTGTVTPATSTDLVAANGFKFPATQVASADPNVLDDYEEGTWTPTLVGSSTAGTYTFSQTNAIYRKIGGTVFVSAFLVLGSASGGSGYAKFAGLPFAKSANQTYHGSMFTNTVDLAAGTVSLSMSAVSLGSSTEFYVAQTVDNGAVVALDISGIGVNDQVGFSFTYFV